MTKTKSPLLPDALEEIKRLRRVLHQIADIDERKYISNGRKVDMVTRMARMALMDDSS